MKILMLDSITYGEDISLDKFTEFGEVVKYSNSTYEEALERVRDHNPDIIVTNKVVIDRQIFEAGPAVKMVAETATGFNNIDIQYANAHNIRVSNVAGYSTDSVIQHTFACLFYLLEKLPYYDEYVKSGKYSESPCFTHFSNVFSELKGKTWGIVGLGNIGRGVGDIANAFGCNVVYFSASGNSYDTPYKKVDFSELLSDSDIISIHAPLNEFTENIFDNKAFAKMKKSAILINMGRGPIVNDADLAKALDENLIAGAALDVVKVEPIEKDNPLLTIKQKDKLLITPHIAWATYEARTRLMEEVYLNIKAFINNDERNVVT